MLVVLALTAPLISKAVGHGPNDLFQREMTDEFGLPKGPNGEFLMGADQAGRDVFVRVIYGARTSLLVALIATGLRRSHRHGTRNPRRLLRREDRHAHLPDDRRHPVDADPPVRHRDRRGVRRDGRGLPRGLIEPGLSLVIFVIALFSWPYIARIVRGSTLSLREKEFIEAARSLGAGNARIMFREVLPNLVAPIIVYATLIIPSNILFEAALSFLGLGVPQTTPSWGRMLSDAAAIFEVAWWLMLFPGLFLITTTLAFNLLGDGLRDALDPRTER
jgi:peptide/nickel transport system permease protein